MSNNIEKLPRPGRNSNIELLRIISMFLIVLSHYTVHNGVNNFELPLGLNRFLLEFSCLGNIGVIIFIIITGYFSINSKHPFKLKRAVSLVLQVLFYSVLFYCLFCLLGQTQFSLMGFIKNCLPVTFRMYWFVSVYLLLYILAPYINVLLNNLSRKQYFRLIVLMLVLFSILPILTTQPFYGNELVQFVMFYMIGGYLGKYKNNFFSNRKRSFAVLFFTLGVVVLSIVMMDFLGLKWSILGENSGILLNRKSLASILIAVSIFSLFVTRKQFSSKIVNTVASCTFGVYLISDNYLVRGILWTEILKVQDIVNRPVLALHMIGSVAIVFVLSALIEYIRINTVEKLFSKVYDRIEKRILDNRMGGGHID